MNRHFPAFTLLLTAAIYFGFAVWLGCFPGALLPTFDMGEAAPPMRTEIRAFYGGIETGIAVVMLLLWKRGEMATGLLVGGIPLAFSATGRCLGMLVDGYFTTHLLLAACEVIGFVFCIVGVFQLRRQTGSTGTRE